MSKIPQGEWTAIAARYAQGESISRIAQSYGCTPPAIHYILKRNRQRSGADSRLPLNGMQQPQPMVPREPAQAALQPEAATPRSRGGEGESPRSIAQVDRPGPVPSSEMRDGLEQRPQPFTPGFIEQGRPHHLLRQQPGSSRERRSTAGLDRELHGRAEAAIEAFRSSFDAALAEGSQIDRQRLRQAAADLMRVAARTTIVLDQLNARAER